MRYERLPERETARMRSSARRPPVSGGPQGGWGEQRPFVRAFRTNFAETRLEEVHKDEAYRSHVPAFLMYRIEDFVVRAYIQQFALILTHTKDVLMNACAA